MALPVTITGISTAVSPVGPFKSPGIGQIISFTPGSGFIQAFGNTFSNRGGQTFTTSATGTSVTSVVFSLGKAGTPTDNISCDIYACDGTGKPTGASLGTSPTLYAGGTLSGANAAKTFVFTPSIVVSPNTQYAAILSRSGAQDSVNYYTLTHANADLNSAQFSISYSGPTPSTSSSDLYFQAYGVVGPGACYVFGRDSANGPTLQAYKSTTTTTYTIATNTALASSWGTTAALSRVYQTFTTGASDATVTSIAFVLNKTGSPTDNLVVDLYLVDTGTNTPTGSSLGTTTVRAGSTLTASGVRYTFNFTFPVFISPNTKYAAVISRSGAVDAANYYSIRRDSLTGNIDANQGSGNYNSTTATWSAYNINDWDLIVNLTTLSSPDVSWMSVATFNLSGNSIQTLSGYQVDNLIHLLMSEGTTASTIGQRYISFDTSTDTFGTAEVVYATQAAVGTATSGWGSSLVVRSTGEVVAFFSGLQTKTSGTFYSRVYYSRRTAVNTWSAAIEVDANIARNNVGPYALLGLGDRVHFLFQDTNTITQRTLLASNTLGTAVTAPGGSSFTVVASAQSFIEGANVRCVYVTNVGTGLSCFTSADTPSFATGVNNPPNPEWGRLFHDVTAVWHLYRNTVDSDLYARKSTDYGATYGTPVVAFTGTTLTGSVNISSYGDIYERGGNFVIPYIVNDNGTLKYNEYIVRGPSIAYAWDANSKIEGTSTITLTNNDRTATLVAGTTAHIRSTTGNMNGSTGAYYAEVVMGANTPDYLGLLSATEWANIVGNVNNGTYINIATNGSIYRASQIGTAGAGFASGDVCCIAWNAGTEKLWVRKNGGLWNNDAAANPATGTNGIDNSAAAAEIHYLRLLMTAGGDAATIRLRAADFTQSPPAAGFTSWMGESLGPMAYVLPANQGTYAIADVGTPTSLRYGRKLIADKRNFLIDGGSVGVPIYTPWTEFNSFLSGNQVVENGVAGVQHYVRRDVNFIAGDQYQYSIEYQPIGPNPRGLSIQASIAGAGLVVTGNNTGIEVAFSNSANWTMDQHSVTSVGGGYYKLLMKGTRLATTGNGYFGVYLYSTSTTYNGLDDGSGVAFQNYKQLHFSQFAAANGVFALVGKAADLDVNRRSLEANGVYGLTGQGAILRFNHRSLEANGIYNIAGQAATFKFNHRSLEANGIYSYTGNDATLIKSAAAPKLLNANTGNYTYTAAGTGAWTPTNLGTDLRGWFDGADAGSIVLNGSGVSSWSNKGVAGFYLADSTGADANRPRYTGNAVTFTTPQVFAVTYSLAIITYDFLVVGKPDASLANWRTLLHNSDGRNTILMEQGTNNIGGYSPTAPYFRAGGTWLGGVDGLAYGRVTCSPGTIEISRDGGSLVDTTITHPVDKTAINYVGGYYGAVGGDQGWGSINELIFVPYNSSVDVRQKLEGYAAWKWGLQSLLPVGHPYKAAAPVSGTGDTVTLVYTPNPNKVMSAVSGAYGITGNAATLKYTRRLAAQNGGTVGADPTAGTTVYINFLTSKYYVQGIGDVAVTTLLGNDPNYAGSTYEPTAITQYGYDWYGEGKSNAACAIGALRTAILRGDSCVIKLQTNNNEFSEYIEFYFYPVNRTYTFSLYNAGDASARDTVIFDNPDNNIILSQVWQKQTSGPNIINVLGFHIINSNRQDLAVNDLDSASLPITDVETPPGNPLAIVNLINWGPLVSIATYPTLSLSGLKAKTVPVLDGGGAATTAYSIAGKASTLRFNHRSLEANGVYGIAGQAATFKFNHRSLNANGVYGLAGQTTTALKFNHRSLEANGVYGFAGQAATFKFNHRSLEANGVYSIAGQPATFKFNHRSLEANGVYGLAGQVATFKRRYQLAAANSVYSYIGQTNILSYVAAVKGIAAFNGIYNYSGQIATLRAVRKLALANTTYSYTGNATALKLVKKVNAANGVYSYTGNAAALKYTRRLAAQNGGTVGVSGPITDGASVYIDFIGVTGYVRGVGNVNINTLLGYDANSVAMFGTTAYYPDAITQYGYDYTSAGKDYGPSFIGQLRTDILAGKSVIFKLQSSKLGTDDFTVYLNPIGTFAGIYVEIYGSGTNVTADAGGSGINSVAMAPGTYRPTTGPGIVNVIGFSVLARDKLNLALNNSDAQFMLMTDGDLPPSTPLALGVIGTDAAIASITVFDTLSLADLKAKTAPVLDVSGPATTAYSIAGQAATLRLTHKFAAANTIYTYTGNAASLRTTRKFAAANTAYSITGQVATFKAARQLIAANTSYSISGKVATFKLRYQIAAAKGTYTFTGRDAALTSKGRMDTGTFTITGSPAILRRSRLFPCANTSYASTGQPASLRIGRKLSAANTVYTISGKDISYKLRYQAAATKGTYSYTGQATTLKLNRTLAAANSSYAVIGKANNFKIRYGLAITQGNYQLIGRSAGLSQRAEYILDANAGTYNLSGRAANFKTIRSLSCQTGDYDIIASVVLKKHIHIHALATGYYRVNGQDVSLLAATGSFPGVYGVAGTPVQFFRTYRHVTSDMIVSKPKKAAVSGKLHEPSDGITAIKVF
jgi:hypothetical protein